MFKIDEVFLIDDDAIVRMVATKILKSIGFQDKISAFGNSQMAIDEIQRRIDHDVSINANVRILLLLDINMPGSDTWVFLDEFSKFDQEIRKLFYVTIITNFLDNEDQLKAFSYPDVLDYITKPLSAKHLTDFLSKHELYEAQSEQN